MFLFDGKGGNWGIDRHGLRNNSRQLKSGLGVSIGENIFDERLAIAVFAKPRHSRTLLRLNVSNLASFFFRRKSLEPQLLLKLFAGLCFEQIKFFPILRKRCQCAKLDKHIQAVGEQSKYKSLKSGKCLLSLLSFGYLILICFFLFLE